MPSRHATKTHIRAAFTRELIVHSKAQSLNPVTSENRGYYSDNAGDPQGLFKTPQKSSFCPVYNDGTLGHGLRQTHRQIRNRADLWVRDQFRTRGVDMKQTLAALVVFVLPVSIALAQTSPPATPASSSLERDFASGGKITMKLSAGGYTIRSGAENKIRMQWETKKPEQLKGVKANILVQGHEATIQARGPRQSDFQVVIELPARADLQVRLSAGDLQIRGIEGNKDVECHAGDITINVGSAADYSRVAASAHAGDIEAPPFGISKGGLFRTFRWQGTGKYALHVHVGAGSVTLLGSK
jgi:hypothetical protein